MKIGKLETPIRVPVVASAAAAQAAPTLPADAVEIPVPRPVRQPAQTPKPPVPQEAQTRKFGVELEFQGLNREQVMDALAGVVGKTSVSRTIEAHASAFRLIDDSGRTWRATLDGGGVEVASPILRGDADVVLIKQVAASLQRAGATANSEAGLHVHVDAVGLTATQLVQVLALISRHEGWLYPTWGVHPERHRFCMPTSLELVEKLLDRRPFDHGELAQVWTQTRPGKDVHPKALRDHRYHGVNLANALSESPNRINTIELRYFNGTVEPSLVGAAVGFASAVIQRIVAGAPVTDARPASLPQLLHELGEQAPWVEKDLDKGLRALILGSLKEQKLSTVLDADYLHDFSRLLRPGATAQQRGELAVRLDTMSAAQRRARTDAICAFRPGNMSPGQVLRLMDLLASLEARQVMHKLEDLGFYRLRGRELLSLVDAYRSIEGLFHAAEGLALRDIENADQAYDVMRDAANAHDIDAVVERLHAYGLRPQEIDPYRRGVHRLSHLAEVHWSQEDAPRAHPAGADIDQDLAALFGQQCRIMGATDGSSDAGRLAALLGQAHDPQAYCDAAGRLGVLELSTFEERITMLQTLTQFEVSRLPEMETALPRLGFSLTGPDGLNALRLIRRQVATLPALIAAAEVLEIGSVDPELRLGILQAAAGANGSAGDARALLDALGLSPAREPAAYAEAARQIGSSPAGAAWMRRTVAGLELATLPDVDAKLSALKLLAEAPYRSTVGSNAFVQEFHATKARAFLAEAGILPRRVGYLDAMWRVLANAVPWEHLTEAAQTVGVHAGRPMQDNLWLLAALDASSPDAAGRLVQIVEALGFPPDSARFAYAVYLVSRADDPNTLQRMAEERGIATLSRLDRVRLLETMAEEFAVVK